MGIFVGENGKINSFDIRDNAIKQALKNVELMRVRDRVEIENADICEKIFDFTDLDFILLDMATPWLAIPKVKAYLKDSGIICCFSPTIEQIKKDYNALLANGFQTSSIFELLTRHFQVKPNATRPVGRMVAHTGYLMFASQKEGSLISKDFKKRYSAENIGYLLIYAGIRPKSKVLLLTSALSPLPNIMKEIFGSIEEFTVVSMLSDSSEQDLEVALNAQNIQLTPESLDCVLIDNITRKTLVDEVKGYLKNGHAVAVLSQYIEHMKSLHIQMAVNGFFEISSCELMKRQIIIEKTGISPESTLIENTGYITIGRKVKDSIIMEEKKPTGEIIENLLEVGRDYADSLPDEPEEIDYANLEEDERE
jgi:tRNA A58 N-methylase Trm61